MSQKQLDQQLEVILKELDKPLELTLNKEQTKAIKEMTAWFSDPSRPHYHLAGYAGTGKTTVVKYALKTMGLSDDAIALCAYTAKAARVLQNKTLIPASTIHRLIYKYRPDKKLEELKLQLKELRNSTSPSDAAIDEIVQKILIYNKSQKHLAFRMKEPQDLSEFSIIVADECSMISEKILKDLLSFKIKVLFVGDSGQLDPIKDSADSRSLTELIPPNFTLQEIMRQDGDNDVIDFASMARRQQPIPHRNSANGFGKLDRDDILEINPDLLLSADQIICHRHQTRRELNRQVRKLFGHTGIYPKQGEKVVCRYNNHDLGIARGVTYTVDRDAVLKDDSLELILTDDEGEICALLADPICFHAYQRQELADDVDKNRVKTDKNRPPFDFGYVLTVHSAQGSEWNKVLVWDDFSMKFKKPEYAKWLYTAITRAKTHCIIAA